jgi:hypothetical protein
MLSQETAVGGAEGLPGHLPAGTRVRLSPPAACLVLRSPFGTIVRPDAQYAGCYVVELDEPALCEDDEIPTIIEAADNMEVLS